MDCRETILNVDLQKLRDNAAHMIDLCADHGVQITGITKGCCSDRGIVEALIDGGIRSIGDSQIHNLQKLEGLDLERWMIRIPAPQEADALIRYAEVSLQSEKVTLEAVNRAARELGKTHKVILMVDLGDLREGSFDKRELLEQVSFVTDQSHLELYGIGTNLGCFNFIRPDQEKMQALLELKNAIGEEIKIVSAGNSSGINLMRSGGMPEGVNHLRLGESILVGRERETFTYLEGMHNDAFILEVPLVECKTKPSMPIGTIGRDSYGNSPKPVDIGERKRGILAIGKQLTDDQTIFPVDPKIQIVGSSSDHLIVDLSDCDINYRVGDRIPIRLGYFAIMRAFTGAGIRVKYCN